jgi:8-oxo-dGTP pyrophosphatase MutT (NUDIX family)
VLDLDPSRSPPVPRPAAPTLVLRDAPAGLEVFCIVRHPRSTFLGGMVAFPGGKVDAADAAPGWEALTTPLPQRLSSMEGLPVAPLPLAVAACREVLEEAAILPLAGAALPQAELSALRSRLGPAMSLASELARLGLRVDVGALRPFSRWVTPEAEARRYDATFFLLAVPAGQEGESDAHETTAVFWSRPAAVLDRWAAGELQMAPPTARSLELLAACDGVASALLLADRQTLLPVCPRYVPDSTGGFLCLPGDPEHEIREPRIAGPSRFVLRDGRFISADPPSPRG